MVSCRWIEGSKQSGVVCRTERVCVCVRMGLDGPEHLWA